MGLVLVRAAAFLLPSMAASRTLFVVMLGRGGAVPVPTWLGGSSWRGRFGDIGVSIRASSIAARAAVASSEGGRRRALHE